MSDRFPRTTSLLDPLMKHGVLQEVVILLTLSVFTVAVFRRIRLPPIIGYMFVGVLAGPPLLGWLKDNPTTHFLGEIGVMFLLFTLGLELPLAQLNRMKGSLLGLGGAQVLIGTLSGAVIASAIGIPWEGALVLGGALAMSSTAIVTKELMNRLELQTRHGQLALGVLLFQDLAAVPFLVITPILGAEAAVPIAMPLLLALGKGIAAVVIILVIGRWVLRPLLREVAASRTAELFTLTTLLLALSAAWITNLLGLSLALGTFLAGMLLAETEFRHQIEGDIRPFRDVLLGLFFITVGMQLNPTGLASTWGWVVLLVCGIIMGKGTLIAFLTRSAGHSLEVAVRTAMVLAQGGEFGIVLLMLAVSAELVNTTDSQPVLAAIVLSMALAPIVLHFNERAAEYLSDDATQRTKSAQVVAGDARPLVDHVIICGYGGTGQSVARLLKARHIRFVALDNDIDQIRVGLDAGEPVLYGDADSATLLRAAGLDRACALVVSFDSERYAQRVVHAARAKRQDLPILVRARDEAALERLLDAGATEGVPETLEASMMLALQLMLLLGLSSGEIFRATDVVRGERYHLLRGLFEREGMRAVTGDDAAHRLRTVILPAGAHAIGRRIHELDLAACGVVVTALRHDGRYCAAVPDFVLGMGDELILHGTRDQLDAAERSLLAG